MIIKYKNHSGEKVDINRPEGSTHVVFSKWTPVYEHAPIFLTDDCIVEQIGSVINIYRNGERVLSGQVFDLLIVKL